MRARHTFLRVSAVLLVTVAVPLSAAAQDVLTIASSECGPGCIATLPITAGDTHGTPLGEEYQFGKNIQAISYQIQYSPASAVASIDIVRSGVMMGMTPMGETTRRYGDTLSHLFSINEGAQKVSGLTAPGGGEIAKLVVSLSPNVKPGTMINFSFVPALTIFSNDTGTITESASQGTLSLKSGTLSVTGMAGTPVVSIAATDVRAAEKKRDGAVFTISRVGSGTGKIMVKYIISGAARNGTDYRRIPSSVVMKPGEGTKIVRITPIDDRVKERAEKVTITLVKSRGYTIGTRRSTITIKDND